MLLIATGLASCASSDEKPKLEKLQETIKPLELKVEEAEQDPAIDIKLIKVPLGSFIMGSDSYPSEKPAHKVEIKEEFYIGKYEVTQTQWQAIMGSNPSYFKGDLNLPVEQVSWNDIKKFLEILNKKSEKYSYRLPSEAEWEYAARATTTGDHSGNLDLMAWYGANSERKTHPVGQKQPNAFGLYDMHGNVYEWCEDPWHPNYQDAPITANVWNDGGDNNLRVLRGGSWYYGAINNRSSYRGKQTVEGYDNGLGFRLVATLRANP